MNQSVTKNRLTGEQIQKITEKIFDTDNCLANYEELTDGFCNTAYRLTLSDGKRVVLKVAPKKGITMMSCEKGMMQTEVAAMKLAREQGISGVPEVYGYDDSYELCDSIYFVMECLDGESYAAARGNMSEKEQAVVNVQTGEYLAGLNRIKGEKFGHFWMKELQWEDWFTAFLHLMEAMISDGERESIDIGIPYGELLEKLKQHRRYFDEVREPSFIHWDSWDGNIFIKNGHVIGMIDWERAMWAEGLMEDRFRYHTKNEDFMRGYGFDGLTESQKIRCAWYDIYLYLIMMFEGTYRHYETNEQYLWVHSLFVPIWEELKKKE